MVRRSLSRQRWSARPLDPESLAVTRSDNGRDLESMLLEGGFDPASIRERRRLLDPAGIRAYLELHIEQGPRLVAKGLPAAVVTGIRGCRRFRNARCIGRARSLRRGRSSLSAGCGRRHGGAAARHGSPLAAA